MSVTSLNWRKRFGQKGLSISPEMDLIVHETLLRACDVSDKKPVSLPAP